MRNRFWDRFFWDPFEEMRRMFATFPEFSDFSQDLPAERRGIRQPLADFWEGEDAFYINIEMPGIRKEDININVAENGLEIRAERKEKTEEKTKNFYRLERNYSGFYRFIAMPENAELEKAEAKYENGVLEIKVPKIKGKVVGKKHIEIK